MNQSTFLRSLLCSGLVACAPSGVPDGDPVIEFRSAMAADGASQTCEWEEELCPTDCEGNTAPTLGEPEYLVNGEPVDQPQLGDWVKVRIPYADAECNLACGGAGTGLFTPQSSEETSYSLCSNQGCSTDADDWYVGFNLGQMTAGEWTFSVRLTDACGANSERVGDTFTL